MGPKRTPATETRDGAPRASDPSTPATGAHAATAEERRGGFGFAWTYVLNELRRRRRTALLVAVGLAVAVGLVATVAAASTGVKRAESAVLHSLYGIGTDVTVTREATPLKPGSPRTANGSSGRFVFSPGARSQQEDLLGYPPGLGALPASTVDAIRRLGGVAGAGGGLMLTDTRLTIPSRSQLGPGGAPPAGALTPVSFSVDGVDPGEPRLGPFGQARLVHGRALGADDTNSDVAVVDSGYAVRQKLTVGSALTIAHVRFTVIGVASQPENAGAADVYIPLARAQALAASPTVPDSHGKVNVIYVHAAGAAAIPALQEQIAKLAPAATVTSSAQLASEVSGSLSSAASLVDDVGRWIEIAALIVAFVLAGLLTSASVGRRVRELGTLKALGWRSRRIIVQLLAESSVTGLAGAVLGVGVAAAASTAIAASAPSLTATIASNPGSHPAENVSFGASGAHHSIASGAEHTVLVHMGAPLTLGPILLAVALALAGALLAGGLGGWRAARMRPADALREVR